MKKFDVFVNPAAGKVLREGTARVRENLERFLGPHLGAVTFVAGDDISKSVTDWAAHAHDDRGLLIGGGDGSVMSAASAIIEQKIPIALGTLPLGTQNMTAREMGFSADYRVAAAQHTNARIVKIPAGSVNGMYYLLAACLDKNLLNVFAAREDLRKKDYLETLRKTFGVVSNFYYENGNSFSISVDGAPETPQNGHVFVFSTAPFSPQPNNKITPGRGALRQFFSNVLKRQTDAAGGLSFYGTQCNHIPITSVLRSLWNGTWDTHPCVRSQKIEYASVAHAGTEEPTEISVILDGEVKTTQYPLQIRFHPQALSMYENPRHER